MTHQRQNQTKYVLLIVLAVCFLATGGIFVKLSSLPPINTGFYRVLFSVPILLPLSGRYLGKLTRKQILTMFAAGVFLALDLIFWNISFQYTTVANANLLANLTPFTVIPVSYFLFKEKINKNFIIGAIITLLGVILLMSTKISIHATSLSLKGDLLSLITSFFYAGFILTVYRLRDSVGSNVIMLVSSIGSLTTLAIAILLSEGFYLPKSVHDFLPLIGLALVSQIFGQGLLSFCLGKVNATISSVITLSQPVIAALYSFLIFSENLSVFECLAIFITLFGVYLAKSQSKRKA
jgi:drug/metabolite transporter (DMT)-like permease